MIIIGNKLISEDLLDREFVCNLSACKGACCVEGDEGAPLEEQEHKILEEILPAVRPYLTEQGKKAIEEQGPHVPVKEGRATPLIENKECAYTVFENGIAKCGIEKAYQKGKVNFSKPISCHLYPIRVLKTAEFEALNFDKWDICAPACKHGGKLRVPVYKFLRPAIERKWGKGFYAELAEIAEAMGK